MKKECFEFMGNLMVELCSTDPLFTYDFLAAELKISKNTVSAAKRGRDMYINSYLHVINYIMKMIHLGIDMCQLAKVIRKVLSDKHDLVVSPVPHHRDADYTPEEWVVILEWESSKNHE